MKDIFKELEKKAKSLKTDCPMRNADIDNIRMIIRVERYYLRRIQRRLNRFAKNPNWAGKHERYKPFNQKFYDDGKN